MDKYQGMGEGARRVLVTLEHRSAWSKECRGLRVSRISEKYLRKILNMAFVRDSDIPSCLISLCCGFRGDLRH